MEKVKLMYEAEMAQQRKVLRDTEDTRAQLEVRVAALEEQLSDAHQAYDFYNPEQGNLFFEMI